MVRANTSGALVAITVGIFSASVIWAWVTPDFWESVPLVPCVLSAAFFSACAAYSLRRKLLPAAATALATAVIMFVVTLSVSSARWGS